MSRQNSNEDSEEDDSIASYIPPYLKRAVFPLQQDFCHTNSYHPQLLVQIMAEGFLPIATRGALLPKLHSKRSVIPLSAGGFHSHKSTRKKCKKFQLTVNQNFDGVVRGCRRQHASCWLYPELVTSFQTLYERTRQGKPLEAKLMDGTTCPVRFYSIEVWNLEGHFVAGELGYTVGSVYTSLTGFSAQDSAGSVQLAVLGFLLVQNGFTLWDLGMDMDYKQDMGSKLMKRRDFVSHVQAVRVADSHVTVPFLQEPVSCKTLMDLYREKPAHPQQQEASGPLPLHQSSHPVPFDNQKSPQRSKKQKGLDETPTDTKPKLARA